MTMQLIVGLGNPGAEYTHTRHNAGFWLLDALADEWGLSFAPEKNFRGLVARTQHQGQTLWLLKPQTFMNRSGQSIAALARFYKIPPEAILVVHDELDLPPGQAKLKLGGSHAGHNGLRDTHAQLGSSQYWRLRIGIGHPGQREAVVGWVLQKPPSDAMQAIEDNLLRCRQAMPDILAGRMEKAMGHIHTSPAKKPAAAKKDPT